MRRPALLLILLATAACSDEPEVNPPIQLAEPLAGAEAQGAQTQGVDGSIAPLLPGTGATSFVGRWAANVASCQGAGANRPIVLTPARFEGYENSCSIDSVDETQTGYAMVMTCASDGATRQARGHAAVSGDVLTFTWLDDPQRTVRFARCRAEGDVVPPLAERRSDTKATMAEDQSRLQPNLELLPVVPGPRSGTRNDGVVKIDGVSASSPR